MPLNAASEKMLARVNGDLVKIVHRASDISRLPFLVVQGFRTAEYQRKLWNQGRTKPGAIVTWKDGYKNKSNHQSGNAIDFAAVKSNGKPDWDPKWYPEIAKAFKQAAAELGLHIIWGGDWHKKDWGHVELVKGGDAAATIVQPIVAQPPPVPQMLVGAPPIASVTPAPLDVGSPRWAVEYLEGLGWSRLVATALVANLIWESGGHDKIIWNAHGDRGKDGLYHSHGAGQWNDRAGRYQQLFQFAVDRRLTWDDPRAQLHFIDKELTSTERATAVRLIAATTIADAMEAALGYWRPSMPHADKRRAIADKLAKELEL